MDAKQEAAFSLGYRDALRGRRELHSPFETDAEAEAYKDGFEEACHRLDDLRSDCFE